ncbi:hypothetical protein EDB86DRAFT_2829213 [Lactarius hatsudake]|nr:hypothetical protein EDB86DRAFT_2829213 [Lactarius hatsudake]
MVIPYSIIHSIHFATPNVTFLALEVLVAGEPDDYFVFYEKVCAEWDCIRMVETLTFAWSLNLSSSIRSQQLIWQLSTLVPGPFFRGMTLGMAKHSGATCPVLGDVKHGALEAVRDVARAEEQLAGITGSQTAACTAEISVLDDAKLGTAPAVGQIP